MGAGAQTDGMAIAALVVAIAGLLLCWALPIPAIVALFLSRSSSQKIAASGGRLGGAGLNTAARIISWITIGIAVLFWALIVVLAATGNLDDDDDFDDDFDSIRTAGAYLWARASLLVGR